MKKATLKLLLLSLVIVFASTGCRTGSSLLSSGSSLLSSLGGNPNLSSFSSLLKTPGLDKVLGPALKGNFTLLAPSNDALSKSSPDMLSNLTKPENIGQLGDVLKNQIIPGKLDASSLMKGGLKTAGGKDLNLGGVNLGDAIGGKIFNIIPVDKLLN